MSMGYVGWAELEQITEESVIYKYGECNLNIKEYWNEQHITDGTITINKRCVKEPEIHIKKKRLPSGRKKEIIKRIPTGINLEKSIPNGDIFIKKSRNCWKEYDGIDVFALNIICHIINKYQVEGEYTQKVHIGV